MDEYHLTPREIFVEMETLKDKVDDLNKELQELHSKVSTSHGDHTDSVNIGNIILEFNNEEPDMEMGR